MDFMEIKKVRKQGNLKVITIPLKSNIKNNPFLSEIESGELIYER